MNTHIITPTSNLSASLSFYQSLGFKMLSENNPIIVTDGSVFVEIDENRYVRPGIRIYSESLDHLATELQELTPIIKHNDQFILQDPTGTTIYLTDQPTPITHKKPEPPFSILGNFAGISLETADPDRTISVWKLLGFTVETGDISQGWVTLTNSEGLSISIMKLNSCPHLFFNPSLTYFNGDQNLRVIERVRQTNIPITEEINHFNSEGIVDNIIIRDPGGFGFFVFND